MKFHLSFFALKRLSLTNLLKPAIGGSKLHVDKKWFTGIKSTKDNDHLHGAKWVGYSVKEAPLFLVNPNYSRSITKIENPKGKLAEYYDINFAPYDVVHLYDCNFYKLFIARHYCHQLTGSTKLVTFVLQISPLINQQHIEEVFKKSRFLTQYKTVPREVLTNTNLSIGITLDCNHIIARQQLKELIAIINELTTINLPDHMQDNILKFIHFKIDNHTLKTAFSSQKNRVYNYPPIITGKIPNNYFIDNNPHILCPEIFNYILADHKPKIEELLKKDPCLANAKSHDLPYARSAHDLASEISSDSVFKLFVVAREKLDLSNLDFALQQHYLRYFTGKWSIISERRLDAQQREKNKEQYLKWCKSIQENQEYYDNWHKHLEQMYSKYNATIPTDIKDFSLLTEDELAHELDTAIRKNNPEAFRKTLYFLKSFPIKYNATYEDLLFDRIDQLSDKMLEIFLAYRKRAYIEGLLAPVTPGPYNSQVSPTICHMLQQHRNDQKKLLNKRELYLRLQGTATYNGNSLIESFVLPNKRTIILSVQKLIATITETEKKQMEELFYLNFDPVKGSIHKQEYFKKIFSKSNSTNIVNLFYDQHKLIAFSTIELKKSYHKSVGGAFVFFHGKLACNSPEYASLDLTTLGVIRNFIVEASINSNPVFMFIKSIPPGLALKKLPFLNGNFHPKNIHYDRSFSKLLAEDLAEDKLEDNKMPCKLEVTPIRKGSSTAPSLELMFFKDYVGTEIQYAMPIILPADTKNIAQFLAKEFQLL